MKSHIPIPKFRSDLEIAFDLFRPVLEPVIAKIVRQEVNKILLQDTETGQQNLYSRKEAGKRLQKSLSTVINWEHEGRLTPVSVGKKIYYRRDQVLALAQ